MWSSVFFILIIAHTSLTNQSEKDLDTGQSEDDPFEYEEDEDLKEPGPNYRKFQETHGTINQTNQEVFTRTIIKPVSYSYLTANVNPTKTFSHQTIVQSEIDDPKKRTLDYEENYPTTPAPYVQSVTTLRPNFVTPTPPAVENYAPELPPITQTKYTERISPTPHPKHPEQVPTTIHFKIIERIPVKIRPKYSNEIPPKNIQVIRPKYREDIPPKSKQNYPLELSSPTLPITKPRFLKPNEETRPGITSVRIKPTEDFPPQKLPKYYPEKKPKKYRSSHPKKIIKVLKPFPKKKKKLVDPKSNKRPDNRNKKNLQKFQQHSKNRPIVQEQESKSSYATDRPILFEVPAYAAVTHSSTPTNQGAPSIYVTIPTPSVQNQLSNTPLHFYTTPAPLNTYPNAFISPPPNGHPNNYIPPNQNALSNQVIQNQFSGGPPHHYPTQVPLPEIPQSYYTTSNHIVTNQAVQPSPTHSLPAKSIIQNQAQEIFKQQQANQGSVTQNLIKDAEPPSYPTTRLAPGSDIESNENVAHRVVHGKSSQFPLKTVLPGNSITFEKIQQYPELTSLTGSYSSTSTSPHKGAVTTHGSITSSVRDAQPIRTIASNYNGNVQSQPLKQYTSNTQNNHGENGDQYTRSEPYNVVSQPNRDQTQQSSHSEEQGSHGGGGGKHHHESGGGSNHESDHHSKKGEKGEKGYKKNHKHDKGKKGHHDKEGHSGEYEEEKKHEKKSHLGEDFYGEHHKEEKGGKGKKYGEGGKHKKGHSTHGEHNVVKKNEYIKSTKFYDEDHDDGEHEEHGEYYGHHEEKKGGKKSGGHKKSDSDKKHAGKKGHHDKGHDEEEEVGHSSAEGHEDHFGHEEEYGSKKGGEGSKKWGYTDEGKH